MRPTRRQWAGLVVAGVIAGASLMPGRSAASPRRITFGIGVGANTNYVGDQFRRPAYVLDQSQDSTVFVRGSYPYARRVWRGGRSIHGHLGYQFSDRLNLNLSALGNLVDVQSLSTTPGLHMRLLQITANVDRRLGRVPGRWFATGGMGYGYDPDGGGRPNGPAMTGGIGRHLGRVFETRLVGVWVVHMRDPDHTDYRGERMTVALLVGLSRR
jgi:hypothetical protein